MNGSVSYPSFRLWARVWAVLIASALLFGCVSAEVVSNKSADYTGTISGLYYQSSVSDKLDRFAEEMAARMQRPLLERGVSVASTHDVYEAREDDDDDAPSLDDDSTQSVDIDFETARSRKLSHVIVIQEEAREEKRTSRMALNPSGGMMMQSSVSQTYSFTADLYVTETEERVWRASIEASGDGMTTQGMEANKAAEKLMEQLEADQLLPDRVQPAQ